MSTIKIDLVKKITLQYSGPQGRFVESDNQEFQFEISSHGGAYVALFGYYDVSQMPSLEEVIETLDSKEKLLELMSEYLEQYDFESWTELIEGDVEYDLFGIKLIEY